MAGLPVGDVGCLRHLDYRCRVTSVDTWSILVAIDLYAADTLESILS
jgi:hypothetical protein